MKLRWDYWMALIYSWSSLRENVESYGKEKSPREVWPYFEVFTFFCFSCCKLYYFVVLPNLYFHSFCSIVLFFRLISCSRNASVFISHSHKKTVDCSWSLVCCCWSVHICRLWSVSHNARHQRKWLILNWPHMLQGSIFMLLQVPAIHFSSRITNSECLTIVNKSRGFISL